MKEYLPLNHADALSIVEELESVPFALPSNSRAYGGMARKLIELCNGDEKTTPWAQARWIIDQALEWETWKGPRGLVELFDSRFARRKSLAPREVERVQHAQSESYPDIHQDAAPPLFEDFLAQDK